MLQLTNDKGIIKVTANTYSLILATDRPFVYLHDAAGNRLAELFVFSSVHSVRGLDDTAGLHPWETQESPDEIILSIRADSSYWSSKVYQFRCRPDRLTYEIEVEGVGQLEEVNYFGGYSSCMPRWGSGFFWSGQHFLKVFNPEPNNDEINWIRPGEGSTIDLMGVPLPGRGNWFFTPPPFCYGLQGANTWLGLGVEAPAGQNNYTEYGYHGRTDGFYLTLSYDGHTSVAGRFRLPAIGFDFGAGPYEVIAGHVAALRAAGYTPRPSEKTHPAWWYEPIFCGWGAQCYLAALDKGKAPDYSRQVLYEQFLRTLEEHQLDPGMIVLDDKWQLTYGENRADENKWPDLAGFVSAQHARGKKVLLWLKAWDPEGVPLEECITNSRGLPLAVDPTNPAFERRLRLSVQNMLSPRGYNADGFKIDFTARIPSGPEICAYGPEWGLELMKRYLGIIYQEAKQVKGDALVITHTPHPYLAGVLDMIRLNDINKDKNIIAAMKARARVASIACPDAIIDTDNWPIKDLASWRKYMRLQPKLGVPSLYYASHIDSSKEPLEARDYKLIQDIWTRHRARRGMAEKSDALRN